MTPWADQIQMLREVVRVFDQHGIAYAIGGSMASSVYGIPRLTRDADVSLTPFAGKEEALAASLGSAYYSSVQAMREANRKQGTFNIIQPSLGFKVDCFVLGNRVLDANLLRRAVKLSLDDAPDQPLAFVSPEDIVLLKLDWYRRGGEISERQWSDVLDVLRNQTGAIDAAYLEEFAERLKVADLLIKAKTEAQADTGLEGAF